MALISLTGHSAAGRQHEHHLQLPHAQSSKVGDDKQSNAFLTKLRHAAAAMKKKASLAELWILGEHTDLLSDSNRDDQLANDFDEELFTAKMYDYLITRDLDGAVEEFQRKTTKGSSFQVWFYQYMNDGEQRATVYTHRDYIFEWINKRYLLSPHQPSLIPEATPQDVRQNQTALSNIVNSRIQWPLPRQGIAPAGYLGTSVSAIYCSMEPSPTTPWVDYPTECRLCFAYRGLLYSGVVSDFSRTIELCGQQLVRR